MDAIFKRISVRKYQSRPVEPEKIEQLLRLPGRGKTPGRIGLRRSGSLVLGSVTMSQNMIPNRYNKNIIKFEEVKKWLCGNKQRKFSK